MTKIINCLLLMLLAGFASAQSIPDQIVVSADDAKLFTAVAAVAHDKGSFEATGMRRSEWTIVVSPKGSGFTLASGDAKNIPLGSVSFTALSQGDSPSLITLTISEDTDTKGNFMALAFYLGGDRVYFEGDLWGATDTKIQEFLTYVRKVAQFVVGAYAKN